MGGVKRVGLSTLGARVLELAMVGEFFSGSLEKIGVSTKRVPVACGSRMLRLPSTVKKVKPGDRGYPSWDLHLIKGLR